MLKNKVIDQIFMREVFYKLLELVVDDLFLMFFLVLDCFLLDIIVLSLSFKVIKIIWGLVFEDFINGEIFGYRVFYNDMLVVKNILVFFN